MERMHNRLHPYMLALVRSPDDLRVALKESGNCQWRVGGAHSLARAFPPTARDVTLPARGSF
jgi:hypothetical protein